MTTNINNPEPNQRSNGNGFLTDAFMLVIFVSLILYFGIPVIKNMKTDQVSIPTTQTSAPAK